MNDLLELKGRFNQKENDSSGGGISLPVRSQIEVSHIEKLRDDLVHLNEYWKNEQLLDGALISVFYKKVIAKSNRIRGTFQGLGQTSNSSVVGSKFSESNKIKHIITHYIKPELLELTIEKYNNIIDIFKNEFNGRINTKQLAEYECIEQSVSKTCFKQIIVDCYYVESFGISQPGENFIENSIISIYETGENTIDLMNRVGINISPNRIIDNNTMLLEPDQIKRLNNVAPYLISMGVVDLSKMDSREFSYNPIKPLSIPKPSNEPTIGVIDTMFDECVYFSEWVEFTNKVDKNIDLKPEDYDHGTAVSSIIVDGPSFNPALDDGCGRFKVRHFGVATNSNFSSFSILKNIQEIVLSNKDIKVWNLSLGSALEINPNFISPEAAILDKIQYENDVIFIIAGTNKSESNSNVEMIGSPADSINSLVVNTVDIVTKSPAKFSRKGPVLSFFVKPDICYYGGSEENKLRVCFPLGEGMVSGTSFAAPWISRKMAYLINILGLNREVSKALIVNSATGWERQTTDPSVVGYGIVPIKIDDITKSPSDEIRFIISGVSEKYNTYTYNLPVPIHEDKHPFLAKATLCYFPYCSRNQGVDYTNTEFDIKFGRVKLSKKGDDVESINKNYQTEDNSYIHEEDARKLYRKWDNIKHVREIIKTRNIPRKVHTDDGLWGINIKTKERLEEKYGNDLKFGLVITLKEMNGVNRIDDFIQHCLRRGWLVNNLNVENRIDIYNTAEQEIDLSDN